MTTKQITRITRALSKIGAAWAVSASKYCSPDDPLEDQAAERATWHVHPDASEPHVRYIQRFDSLKELEAWISEQKAVRRAELERMSISLTPEQKRALRQRYGSIQRGVTEAVEKELKNV